MKPRHAPPHLDSKPASTPSPPSLAGAMNVVGQLYQFTRFGFEGYAAINQHMLRTTAVLVEGLTKLGCFEVISSSEGLPLVAFHLKASPAVVPREECSVWSGAEWRGARARTRM